MSSPRRLTLVTATTAPAPPARRALPPLNARELSLITEAPAPARSAASRHTATPMLAPARKLAELVRVQAECAGAITAEAERRLLEYGVQELDLSSEECRSILGRVTRSAGAVLQREVEPAVRELLATIASRRRGRVTRASFEHAVGFYRARVKSSLPEAEIRLRVKTIMADCGWRPKRLWFWPVVPAWYRSIV